MTRTWKQLANEAIQVQDACNLSGVIHSFSNTIREVRELLENEGTLSTDIVNKHPICVLYSSKIASLTGSEIGRSFHDAYCWAKELTTEIIPGNISDDLSV